MLCSIVSGSMECDEDTQGRQEGYVDCQDLAETKKMVGGPKEKLFKFLPNSQTDDDNNNNKTRSAHNVSADLPALKLL